MLTLEVVQCDYCGWEGFISELIYNSWEDHFYENVPSYQCPRCRNFYDA